MTVGFTRGREALRITGEEVIRGGSEALPCDSRLEIRYCGKREGAAMNITIEIPDDCAARFQEQAQARGLTVDRWLLELAEQNAPALPARESSKPSLAEVFAKVRGLADDLDFSRDPSPGRDIVL